MTKREEIYLHHIIEAGTAIEQYLKGHPEPARLLIEDDRTKQATLHRLQTLGESVKHLPVETRQAISTKIRWQRVVGYRNILVHQYLGVDTEVTWQIIKDELPQLVLAVQSYLEKQND